MLNIQKINLSFIESSQDFIPLEADLFVQAPCPLFGSTRILWDVSCGKPANQRPTFQPFAHGGVRLSLASFIHQLNERRTSFTHPFLPPSRPKSKTLCHIYLNCKSHSTTASSWKPQQPSLPLHPHLVRQKCPTAMTNTTTTATAATMSTTTQTTSRPRSSTLSTATSTSTT